MLDKIGQVNRYMYSHEQKSAPKRGRPRSFDAEVVAGRAVEVFATKGLSGTSMDEVAASTGLYRTSLAAAFKDKRGVYLAALASYRVASQGRTADALGQASLRDALRQFLSASVTAYLGHGDVPPGCFLISTAVTEAAADPGIRRALAETLAEMDQRLAARLAEARSVGDLASSADPEVLARLVTGALVGLAVRARAGAARADLLRIAEGTIDLVCGPASES